MLVSRHWLQKFFDRELPTAEKLAQKITLHAFEIESVKSVGTDHGPSDEILDVKVTPNRGHDCLSHRGIAKEISAILTIPITHDPLGEVPTLAPTTDAVEVTIQDPLLCKRYIAGYLRNVKVRPSPQWLKRNLEAIGQRSINNVVDATNFVMLNLGQPLHAFDASKLENREGKYAIIVRTAAPGEKMTVLDGKEYILSNSMLVIVDAYKNESVGIAGVKGGIPAAITEETKDIIIESANFDAVCVRKTAGMLKLRTDASTRFEQVLSPELAAYGMHAVVNLIQKVAEGEVVGFVDHYPTRQQPWSVRITVEKINQVLGTTLTGAGVADVFTRLQFSNKEKEGLFDVSIPFERLDLTIPEDLVEEVGRIIGYDKIPATELSTFLAAPAGNKNFYVAEQVRQDLAVRGYSEVLTSVFADRGERAVLNKVDSVKPYLRANLIDGLVEALKKNIPNKDLLALKEIKLFEIGTVWKSGKEEIVVGMISEKGKATEKPLEEYSHKEPKQYEILPISTAERYQPFSKYPCIVRDIALWAGGAESEKILEMITKVVGELCVRASLFDQFERQGKISYAFRLIFQSYERTLTEVEVNQIMEKISVSLKQKGFEIR
jgi:phenylalanyl-tRNA synthetase beta chain